jgi:glycosyltransferase involved in cell wall biosynthesis
MPNNNGPATHTYPLTVDVVIPLYNASRFIERTLASVLAQTCLPRRIILVDDGSTDTSRDVVRAYMARYSGPVLIDLLEQTNAGPNSARNRGLHFSDAPLLAFLDADDLWMPSKLERQIELFAADADKNLLLAYCRAHWVDEQDSPCVGPPLNPEEPIRGHVFAQLLPRNIISGGSSAVVIRREAFLLAGDFDEKLRAAEDFDMWLRIAQVGRIDLVQEDLVAIRNHTSNTTKDTLYMLDGLLDFYNKWFEQGKDRTAVMHEWGHLVALFAARANDPKKAREKVFLRLSREQRKALFARTFGSYHLYVFLKKLRAGLGRRAKI